MSRKVSKCQEITNYRYFSKSVKKSVKKVIISDIFVILRSEPDAVFGQWSLARPHWCITVMKTLKNTKKQTFSLKHRFKHLWETPFCQKWHGVKTTRLFSHAKVGGRLAKFYPFLTVLLNLSVHREFRHFFVIFINFKENEQNVSNPVSFGCLLDINKRLFSWKTSKFRGV